MKVLVTLFDIQDYGGIIQHTELLLRGLKELGHETTFRILRNTERAAYRTSDPIESAVAYVSHASEIDGAPGSPWGGNLEAVDGRVWASQTYGWRGAWVQGYAGAQLAEYRALANAHDLVLHEIPVAKPSGDGWWLKMFQKIKPPQISISHDAHFRELYPHLLHAAPYLAGVACVHQSSYRALELMPVQRAMIPSGHVPRYTRWTKGLRWNKRQRRFVCAHTWKRWKKMDLVVRAIPHLPKSIRNLIGGDGIERRYMASKDKCRDAYMIGKKRIWDEAIIAGMNYKGDIHQEDLLNLYEDSRAMVDLSYSDKFVKHGCHVNRSTFDAYNGGSVPFVVAENMQEVPGKPSFFSDMNTHCSLPFEACKDPKLLATALGTVVELPEKDATRIVNNGREILETKFHYRKAAEDYIRLAVGKNAGIYGKVETGSPTKEFKKFANEFVKDYAEKEMNKEKE